MLAQCAGLPWVFCPILVPGDPGGGGLRYNAEIPDDVTILSFSDACADKRNPPVAHYIGTWDKSTTLTRRGTLIITSRSPGRDVLHIFDIVGSTTDREGWSEVSVKCVEAFGTFQNGEALAVQFFRTGDTAAVREGEADQVSVDTAQAVLLIGEELADTKTKLNQALTELDAMRAALNALLSEATAEAA